MKINEESRIVFDTIKAKHNLTKESLLTKIFGTYLKKSLEKDPKLNRALKDADVELDKFQSYLKKIKAEGGIIPTWAEKYMK